ncbi:hypothetical protein [Nocardia africana]
MSEAKLRETAEKHAAAVIAGDVESVLADLDPTLHEHVPAMVAAMPESLAKAELCSLGAHAAGGTTDTRYIGRTGSVVVRATWELRGDRYVVTAAQPVE